MLGLFAPPPSWTEGPFGVITVRATEETSLFRGFGAAVAHQRPEQLDRSRRAARGTLAARFGSSMAVSDEQTLRTSYTEAELQAQFDRLPARIRKDFMAYAEGVNAELPASLARWTVIDSVAVAVHLLQIFGRGGSGELRNLALLSYLQAQSSAKSRAFDIFDDLAWFEDPEAPTTLDSGETRRVSLPRFLAPTRAQTEAHLKALPQLSILEILGASKVASREESRRMALSNATPFRSGSYAVAVAAKRSTTGHALLLSGPQMGFTNPSIAHEIILDSPSLKVSGLDVPGVPAILVGATPKIAWGLTTGVADTEDIVMVETEITPPKIDRDERDLKLADGTARKITRERFGGLDLIFRTSDKKRVFFRRRAYQDRELASLEALFNLYGATSAATCDAALKPATMNLNVIFAAPDAIGWRYAGLVPVRSGAYDPRLPIPNDLTAGWRGTIPFSRMPHVIAPASGILSNWNTKPMRGWPNWDTPVWGVADHVRVIRDSLSKGLVSPDMLAAVPKEIAQRPYAFALFRPYLPASFAWDGVLHEASFEPNAYASLLDSLRKDLFGPLVGDLGSPATLRTVVQEHVLLKALKRRTKVDYLRGRDPRAVVAGLLAASSVSYAPSRIGYGEGSLTYLNRGTFLQLVELGPTVHQRSALPPGVAETGPHAGDQIDLARAFALKPLATFGRQR